MSSLVDSYTTVVSSYTSNIPSPSNSSDTSTSSTMVYPPEITSDTTISNFLAMRSITMTSANRASYFEARKNFTNNNAATGFETVSTINIYMPPMVESVQQNYDETTQSLLGQFINEMAHVNSLGELTENLGKGAGMALGAALRTTLGIFSDAYQQQSGKIVSPNIIGAYKGPTRRTQMLIFQFHPKSTAELAIVSNIIKTWYRGSLPKQEGNPVGVQSTLNKLGVSNSVSSGVSQSLLVYSIPNLWMLEEVSTSADTRYTPRFIFGPAALTSIRMNKTPDQYWKTFAKTAGDSASIEVELMFTEMFPMDLDTYENDLGSNITGYTGGNG